MINVNNKLFNIIEDYIDVKAGNPLIEECVSKSDTGAEFQSELALREKLETAWSSSKKFEDIKSQINTIHNQGKKTNKAKRYISYAAAASILILLALPSYQYFVKQNIETLEMNEMEVKSAFVFLDTSYRQISPIMGQIIGDKIILFQWDTDLEVKTSFIITDTETGKIVFTQSINSGIKQYEHNHFLGKGKYTWQLEGFIGKVDFIIR